jgi:hypothetical protein
MNKTVFSKFPGSFSNSQSIFGIIHSALTRVLEVPSTPIAAIFETSTMLRPTVSLTTDLRAFHKFTIVLPCYRLCNGKIPLCKNSRFPVVHFPVLRKRAERLVFTARVFSRTI